MRVEKAGYSRVKVPRWCKMWEVGHPTGNPQKPGAQPNRGGKLAGVVMVASLAQAPGQQAHLARRLVHASQQHEQDGALHIRVAVHLHT